MHDGVTHEDRRAAVGGRGDIDSSIVFFFQAEDGIRDVERSVGSGDSFLAGLTYKLLNAAAPQEALAFACALGALVASYHGATPEISLQQIESFMHPA